MSKSYNEADLVIAIEAIKKDPKLSIRRPAAFYRVPRSTLQARVKGRASRYNTMPNSRFMTDLEEEVILSIYLT